MKRLKSSLLILFIIAVTDWLFFVLSPFAKQSQGIQIAFFIGMSLFLFIFLVNLIYKLLFDFNSSNIKVIAFVGCSLLLSMFLANRLMSINKYYEFSKKINQKTSGNLWQADAFLSHKGVKNAVGYYEYFIADSINGKIKTAFDSLGFRTVEPENRIISDTLNLFLGCSCTFGDYITAEESFPYKTGKALNHNFFNCGASAYGIGQMIQLIDSLIPKYKFNYVFIQLSPWLAERAMHINGPTSLRYRPFPYFSDSENGFVLNYPAYKTNMYANTHNFRVAGRSYFEKLHFMFTEGFNNECIDYCLNQWSLLKIQLGFLPEPTKRKQELEQYFYEYAIRKITAHGATPVILKLRYPKKKCAELLQQLHGKAQIIDLDVALDSVVRANPQEGKNLLGIYHASGNKRIYYDKHPNPYACDVMSNYIITNLKNR